MGPGGRREWERVELGFCGRESQARETAWGKDILPSWADGCVDICVISA